MPAISVITPTFNRRPALERAIRSVQRQTLSDYEHLVIDDSSQDDTEAFMRGFPDPRVRYLRFDHWRGANPARNAGIQAANAGLVTFLDSDDEFLPHRLETTVRRLESRPDVQLLLSSFQTLKRGRVDDSINPGVELTGSELEHVLMTHGVYIAGTSITVRRSLLIETRGFAPTLLRMQDRELLLRLSQHCGAILLPEVDWIKHHSSDSISGPRDGYIESLGALFQLHTGLAARYPDLLGYHIARHILSAALRGEWSRAYASFQTNRRDPALGLSMARLVHGYRAGSARRRALAAELQRRAKTAAQPAAVNPCDASPRKRAA